MGSKANRQRFRAKCSAQQVKRVEQMSKAKQPKGQSGKGPKRK